MPPQGRRSRRWRWAACYSQFASRRIRSASAIPRITKPEPSRGCHRAMHTMLVVWATDRRQSPRVSSILSKHSHRRPQAPGEGILDDSVGCRILLLSLPRLVDVSPLSGCRRNRVSKAARAFIMARGDPLTEIYCPEPYKHVVRVLVRWALHGMSIDNVCGGGITHRAHIRHQVPSGQSRQAQS